MKLALDHHFPGPIAPGLRDRGHDVVAAIEVQWNEFEDPVLFEHCVEDGRALLTNNARDFVPIIREWGAEGRSHLGLILTDDSSWPRTLDNAGRYIDALDALLTQHPADDALVDRVRWL